MKNEPTIKQWEKLYEVACNIKIMQPWSALWDTDIITIQLPNRDEPIFISTMGRGGECYGIGVYPGLEEMGVFYDMLSSTQDDEVANPMFYQNCMTCYFGNRDELSPKEREIIKELGLKFRGKDNWIYFRSMKPGYYPWFLTSDEVSLMTEALQNYVMSVRCVLEDRLYVNFEQNETLFRIYSKERQEWLNYATQMPEIPRTTLIIDEKELTDRIKSMPKTKSFIEIDRKFIPTPVQEKKTETPHFLSLIAILDRNNGECITYDMVKTNEKDVILLSLLLNYFDEHGKPTKIFIRNDRMKRYLADFCQKTGITLVSNKGMRCFDEFAQGMFAFLDNGR